MVLVSEGDDKNDAASSQPLTGETTATERQRLATSMGTLTSPSLSSSSNPPGGSLHALPQPTLPFELVAEILLRLPVKFLMQLRCICKSWNSLISDPKFAKQQLCGSPTHFTHHHVILNCRTSSGECLHWASPLPSVFNVVSTSVPEMQLRHPLNNQNRFDAIVGSCDGILCLDIAHRFALLWNPSTGKFKKLPTLENARHYGSYTTYGFGYDHFTDSYKVVAVFCRNGVCKTQVKVHTLGTNSWRRIQDFPSGVSYGGSGKFVSGTVNWMASTSPGSLQVIASLHLGKESYQELLQPDFGEVAMFSSTLGVLRDCLCILSHSYTFSDVWIMKEYGNKESWTKLFTVPLMGGLDSFSYTKVLYMSDDDELLLEFQSDLDGLVVYNSRNGTFKIPKFQNSGWMLSEVYVESLISPCF